MKRIIRGLSGLNFVGADIVEVAPAYDNGMSTLDQLRGLADGSFSGHHWYRCSRYRARLPDHDAN